RAVPVGHHATLRRQKNMDRERLDAVVRLGHAGYADKRIVLDVGERRLLECRYARIVGKLYIEHRAVACLEDISRTIDLLDLSSDTSLLLRVDGCREKQSNCHRADCPARHIRLVHYEHPPDLAPAKSRSQSGE